MAKLGTTKIQTANGTVEVPVFELADVDRDPIRVETASGPAAVNLVDPVEADREYTRVNTQSWGVQSVNSSVGESSTTNYLEDDWDDNSLTNRSSPNDGIYSHPQSNEAGNVLIGRYRPDWTIVSGSPSAANQQLELPNGSTTAQTVMSPSEFVTGSYSVDWQLTSTTSDTSWAVFYPIDHDTGSGSSNSYGNIIQGDGGKFNFLKVVSGTVTHLISSTWASDTVTHTSKITRNSYGRFELFKDGTSQGTTTDTEFTASKYTKLRNAINVQVNFDNLVIQ